MYEGYIKQHLSMPEVGSNSPLHDFPRKWSMNRPIKFINNGIAKKCFLGSDGRRGTWLLETLRVSKIGASQLSQCSLELRFGLVKMMKN